MKNALVADLLRKIAQLLEIKNELVFKIRAYEKAALVIESLEEDIEDVWKEGRLDDIPGVGKALAEKISEFLEKGKLEYYEKLKKEVPVNMEDLGRIPGLGPKTIMKIYKTLSIKNLDDLEKAAKAGKIKEVKGLGPIVERNILDNIKIVKDKRFPFPTANRIANSLKYQLRQLKEVGKIEIAGSIRRRKPTIGDIDLLITSKNPEKVMDFFTKMDEVDRVLAKGPTKSSVRLKEGIQADLRVVPEENFGAALIYFTGSKQHNIELRKIAIRKGMKLSEYGLFDKDTNKFLAGRTEKDCYKKLGLKYLEPEQREE